MLLLSIKLRSSFKDSTSRLQYQTLQTITKRQPSYTRVFLCRHGETNANKNNIVSGNRIDSKLTERGKKQALALAMSFSIHAIPINEIMSSELTRAYDTACIIHQENKNAMNDNKGSVKKIKDLHEMDYGGVIDGVALKEKSTFEQVKKISETWRNDPHGCYVKLPGDGESFVQVVQRMKGALHNIIKDTDSNKNIVIVTHSRVNKAFLSYCLIDDNYDSHKRMQKACQLMHLIPQDNCCMNVIDMSIVNNTDEEKPLTMKSVVRAINIKPTVLLDENSKL